MKCPDKKWFQSSLLVVLAASTFTVKPVQSQDTSAAFISNLGQADKAHNVTFAINWSTKPDQLSFYLRGPASYSWTGIGIGKGMKGSLMLIVYPNSNGKNLTISPRISTDYSEPAYNKSIGHELLGGSGIFDGVFVARVICHDCLAWGGGSLDLKSTTQPFFYAVGPDDVRLNSNAFEAGLRRHEHYGQFTMNMVSATGDPAGFPGDISKNRNSTASGKDTNDHDYGSTIHAILMVGVFVIVFPFGAAFLKLQNSVMWHWITQSIGVVGTFVGVGIGINLSQQYNNSRHYASQHQIVGLLVFLLILVQWSFGGIHHMILYKKHPQPSMLSKIHRSLGPFVILLGIINSFLGFSFALERRYMIVVGLLIIVVLGLLAGAFFLKSRRERRRGVFATPAAQNFQGAYVPAQNQFDIPLEQQGTPPAYHQSRPLYT